MTYFLITVMLLILGGICAGLLYVQHRTNNLRRSLWDNKGYNTTKQISTLFIDEGRKSWYVIGCFRVYSYSEILDFSISENGVKYKADGGVIRSVVGGSLFGATGAIVGSATANRVSTVSNLSVEITVNDPNTPLVTIALIIQETQTSSFVYQNAMSTAKEIIAQLTYMKSTAQQSQTKNTPFNEISAGTVSDRSIIAKVVGVTKNNDNGQPIQYILSSLSEDSDFMLVREPNNPYDTNAIKVIADYQHIGYVKAELAQQLAPIMDKGNNPKVELLGVTGGGDKNYGCNIRILI